MMTPHHGLISPRRLLLHLAIMHPAGSLRRCPPALPAPPSPPPLLRLSTANDAPACPSRRAARAPPSAHCYSAPAACSADGINDGEASAVAPVLAEATC
eukprot:gene18897-21900_t